MSITRSLQLRPPPGVIFTPWTDGSIVFTYTPETLQALRATLENASKELLAAAIQQIRDARDAELAQQRLPKSRLEILTEQLNQLESLASEEVLITDIADEVPPSTLNS